MRKLLGRFNLVSFYELPDTLAIDVAENEQEETFLLSDDETSYYSMAECMRVGTDSRFDGVIGLTNTSGIGVVLSRCNSQATLQLLG